MRSNVSLLLISYIPVLLVLAQQRQHLHLCVEAVPFSLIWPEKTQRPYYKPKGTTRNAMSWRRSGDPGAEQRRLCRAGRQELRSLLAQASGD